MAIDVRVPTILRQYTGGAKAVQGSGDTLAELLTNLDEQYPGIRGRLITDDGGLHRFVNIYVNDEDVRFLGALDAKVSDGDSVTILPAVAGGAFGFAALAAISQHGAALAAISQHGAAVAAISQHGAAATAPRG
jgi:molybdopterin synthase sulfur carrier subunit